jgi:hypothetical protein
MGKVSAFIQQRRNAIKAKLQKLKLLPTNSNGFSTVNYHLLPTPAPATSDTSTQTAPLSKSENSLLYKNIFPFAVLFSAISFTTASSVLLCLGLIPITAAGFYLVQKSLRTPILDHAKWLVAKNRSEMKPESTISINGSWTHRRHASDAIVDVIDVGTNKIIDFEILTKSTKQRSGNYTGSSNGMELDKKRRIFQRFYGDPNVKAIVHDKDSKISKLIHESNWDVSEIINTNHGTKAFERAYEGLTLGEKKGLRGLKERLSKWLKFILHSPRTKDEKLRMWTNSANHYQGRHQFCEDPNHSGFICSGINSTDGKSAI